MKVYVLTQGIYSYEHIIGVYSDMERAKAQIPQAAWFGPSDDEWLYGAAEGHWPGKYAEQTAHIFELELDAPAALEND